MRSGYNERLRRAAGRAEQRWRRRDAAAQAIWTAVEELYGHHPRLGDKLYEDSLHLSDQAFILATRLRLLGHVEDSTNS